MPIPKLKNSNIFRLILFSAILGFLFSISAYFILFNNPYPTQTQTTFSVLFFIFSSFLVFLFNHYFLSKNIQIDQVATLKYVFLFLLIICLLLSKGAPKASPILPEKTITISVSPNIITTHETGCTVEIFGIKNGGRWISLESLESNDFGKLSGASYIYQNCEEGIITWKGKIIDKIIFNFMQRPDGALIEVKSLSSYSNYTNLYDSNPQEAPISVPYKPPFPINIIVNYLPRLSIAISISYSIFSLLMVFNHFLDKKLTNRLSKYVISLSLGTIRLILAMTLLGFGILLIYISNNFLPQLHIQERIFQSRRLVPELDPIGSDFRNGLYKPAVHLLQNGFRSVGGNKLYNIYPPIVYVLSIPYLLMNESQAYTVHVGLLFIANLATITALMVLIKGSIFQGKSKDKLVINSVLIALFFLISFYHFSSYGFAFSIERGNYDIFALFFGVISIYILLKTPKKIWLQVFFLSLATQLKIYPAILFTVFFLKHRGKLILPMIAINIIMLFIAGPKIAIGFLSSITASTSAENLQLWQWIGNHSATSFVVEVLKVNPELQDFQSFIRFICIFIPISFWLYAFLKTYKSGFSPRNALFLLMISIPLMNIIPNISHDYKLIILSSSITIFLGFLLHEILYKNKIFYFHYLFIMLLFMFFLHRSFFIIDPIFLRNKYLLIIALETIMVLFTNRMVEPTNTSNYTAN